MERKLYELNRFDNDVDACLVEPQVLAAGVTATGWLGMLYYDRIMFLIQGGPANDAAAALDVQVNQATSNAGANSKIIAGKAIVQVVAGAGFATLNQLFLIHVDISELDVDGYFAYVNLDITVSALDTWTVSVVPLRQHRVHEVVPRTNVTQLID